MLPAESYFGLFTLHRLRSRAAWITLVQLNLAPLNTAWNKTGNRHTLLVLMIAFLHASFITGTFGAKLQGPIFVLHRSQSYAIYVTCLKRSIFSHSQTWCSWSSVSKETIKSWAPIVIKSEPKFTKKEEHCDNKIRSLEEWFVTAFSHWKS